MNLSCAGYKQGSNSIEKISLSAVTDTIPLDSFFDRGIADDDCGELVNLALAVPGIDVVAAGPASCSRVLYFRAAKKRLEERLFLHPISSNDFTAGNHLQNLEESLTDLAASRRSRAIIVYVTCADILAGTDFASITGRVECQHGIPVKVFERGPLFRRRTLPKERLCDIFIDLLQRGNRSGSNNCIHLLGDAGKLAETSGLRKMLMHYCSDGEIREFAALDSYEQFEEMTTGKLNIALDRFGYDLAVGIQKNWNIPFVFLPACYNMKEIKGSYGALMKALHTTWDFSQDSKAYHQLAAQTAATLAGKQIAVGIGARSFELAYALTLAGFSVSTIFADTVNKNDRAYINALLAIGSQAQVYLISNVTSETQAGGFAEIDVAIGEKAAFYCAKAKEILVSADYRFGYEGITEIMEAMR